MVVTAESGSIRNVHWRDSMDLPQWVAAADSEER
jgi:hypothetical protein